MKRKILLPTDFSKNAWSAAQYAINLYSEEECTFYFLNSLAIPHPNPVVTMTSRLVNTMKEISKRDLNEVKTKAEKYDTNSKHDFQVISTSEDLMPAINRAVQRYEIDLVVTGTKGASGVNKFFMGSNTVKVIQNLKFCPVLAVPDKLEFKAPEHIAFPTGFGRVFENKEVKALLEFSNLFNTHIHVLHISSNDQLNDIQEGNMRMLQNYLEDYEHTFHYETKSTTKSDEINHFIQKSRIDVLAMVNYNHSFIEDITNEPIIKNIGFKPTVPFLVIPE